MNISQEMLTTFTDDPDLLKKNITGDESSVYGYDIETKAQSSQWKRAEKPRPKKTHQVLLNMKVLLTVFFDRIILFLIQGRTVNTEYCAKQFVRSRRGLVSE